MLKFCISLFAMGLLSISAFAQLKEPSFYAPAGSENVIVFEHEFDSDFSSLESLQGMSQQEREEYAELQIKPLMKFLFGPGTYRAIGSPQRNDVVIVHWNQARVVDEHVVLPYRYIGTWILDLTYSEKGQFAFPVPRSYKALFTPEWKGCTDRAPEHATESFYWYFWDPSRPSCDHKEGAQFDNVMVNVGTATISQTLSYPEYGRMFRSDNGQQSLSPIRSKTATSEPMNIASFLRTYANSTLLYASGRF